MLDALSINFYVMLFAIAFDCCNEYNFHLNTFICPCTASIGRARIVDQDWEIRRTYNQKGVVCEKYTKHQYVKA